MCGNWLVRCATNSSSLLTVFTVRYGLFAAGSKEITSVYVKHNNQEYLLCSLQQGSLFQQSLDLGFMTGESLTLFTNGKGKADSYVNCCSSRLFRTVAQIRLLNSATCYININTGFLRNGVFHCKPRQQIMGTNILLTTPGNYLWTNLSTNS